MAVTGKNVHPALMQVHQVKTVEQLFWAVESAPEPHVTTGGVVLVPIEELAIPWIYGLPVYAWPEEFSRAKQKSLHTIILMEPIATHRIVVQESIPVWR